jgi:Uma2 family endonuclease
MTLATIPNQVSPEDLLKLENDGLFELVDGKLVDKEMSFLASRTAGLIIQRLGEYVEKAGGGEVLPELTFQCFPHDASLIRRPDIAYIQLDRAANIPDEGHVHIAPDIAIEVISPGDRINDFEDKLEDYRSAGIRLVWEVNPKFRYIRVHHADRKAVRLEEEDLLTGEDVLPGFSIHVKDLLPPKSA